VDFGHGPGYAPACGHFAPTADEETANRFEAVLRHGDSFQKILKILIRLKIPGKRHLRWEPSVVRPSRVERCGTREAEDV